MTANVALDRRVVQRDASHRHLAVTPFRCLRSRRVAKVVRRVGFFSRVTRNVWSDDFSSLRDACDGFRGRILRFRRRWRRRRWARPLVSGLLKMSCHYKMSISLKKLKRGSAGKKKSRKPLFNEVLERKFSENLLQRLIGDFHSLSLRGKDSCPQPRRR